MASNKCLVLCSARNCFSTQHSSSLHKFPKDETRAKEWANRCGRSDFIDLIKLYGVIPGNYRLCALHFSNNQFLNCNAKRKTLVHDAMPSNFNLRGAASNSQFISTGSSEYHII